jgi:hypothetical protein
MKSGLAVCSIKLRETGKEFGHEAMYSTESQTTFQKNTSPPSTGLKNKPNKKKKPARSRYECLKSCEV